MIDRRRAPTVLVAGWIAAAAWASPLEPSWGSGADFDGDGYDDLAIGVPHEDVGSVNAAGAVNVLYGSSTGLTAVDDQIWHRDSDGVNGAPGVVDAFGKSLATADFDGDGYDDLAVGLPYADINGFQHAGSVHVFYGSVIGLTADDDEIWSQFTAGVLGVAEFADWFGEALTAADFDGDGYDDLAIGAPEESVGDADAAGAVNVLYGSSNGLTTVGNQIWHQDSPDVPKTARYLNRFGAPLASGDFDCDGYDDLAIYSYEDGGSVTILHGSTTGITAKGAQFWSPYDSGITGNDTSSGFGESIAAGDFDGWNCDDLAIGADRGDPNGLSGAGAVHVLYGSLSGGLTTEREEYWHQASPGVRGVGETGDSFGSALIACDYDGNGADDLAVSSRGEDVGSILNAGAVNILYGTPFSGLSAGDDQIWHQNTDDLPDLAEQYDYFGDALGAGDFDGDGRCDLAIGAGEEDIGDTSRAGSATVLYGEGPDGLGTDRAQFWHHGSPGVRGVVENGDNFGFAFP